MLGFCTFPYMLLYTETVDSIHKVPTNTMASPSMQQCVNRPEINILIAKPSELFYIITSKYIIDSNVHQSTTRINARKRRLASLNKALESERYYPFEKASTLDHLAVKHQTSTFPNVQIYKPPGKQHRLCMIDSFIIDSNHTLLVKSSGIPVPYAHLLASKSHKEGSELEPVDTLSNRIAFIRLITNELTKGRGWLWADELAYINAINQGQLPEKAPKSIEHIYRQFLCRIWQSKHYEPNDDTFCSVSWLPPIENTGM
jgi:hypothetical protein